MHHSGGAAAETIYIYGRVIDQAHQTLGDKCKTCVVGLGLGYIEITWALSLLKNNLTPSSELSFHSFEIVSELQENFLKWVRTTEAEPVYDLIVEKLQPNKPVKQVKEILNKALENGSTIQADISEFIDNNLKFNVICYDAFSRKTNEGLWSYEFLNSFLIKFAAENCVFTTYACTSVLRKTLTENGFQFLKRPGFSGKRESSLATRAMTLNHS